MQEMIQIAASLIGSLGFAALYNLHGKKLWIAGVGGMICWGSYLGFLALIQNGFMTNLLATVAATTYAEMMARVQKTPVTVYLISAIIPMVPGGTLYYTMNYAIAKEWDLFYSYGQKTLMIAAAMAGGIMIVSSFFRMYSQIRDYYKKRKSCQKT